MGWIVFLLAIGFGGLLLWQNLQGITLIFFGGVMTMTLPIAAWVLLFILAGIISSLTLQFLYRFGRPLARPADSPRNSPRPAPNPVAPRQPYVNPEPVRSNVPPVVPPASRPVTDWEGDSDDDWNFATPPEEPPTRIQDTEKLEIVDRPVADSEPPETPPASPARTAQIYSYSYRTAKETKGEKAEPVYDANYRIITPPSGENVNEGVKNDDEEDWI